MATRTYRISLVGDAAHTARAVQALGDLFDGDGLSLLSQRLSDAGLNVQHLSSDENEIVLFITPEPAASVAQMGEAASQPVAAEPRSHGGGGTAGTEEPP